MLNQPYTSSLPCGGVAAQELRAFAQGLAGFRNVVRRELPDVRNDRPDFQFHGDARGARLIRKASRVVAQSLIRAYMNEQRRKTCEIGIER